MKEFPDNSVDMIICDLPYAKTRNKWDRLIPFEDLWGQYERIIKEDGAILLFGQGTFSAHLMLSNEKMFRYSLIWEKDRPTGFLNAKRMPLRSHEDILVFYKRLPTYNPQFWEGEPLHGMGSKFKTGEYINNNYGEVDYSKNPSLNRKGETKKYPRSVLSFKRPHPPIFPTQKPVELVQYLINTYSNEGDIVLDNCLGSGTTALACINTKRHYIGIEKDKDNYQLACNRVNEHEEVIKEGTE